MRAFIFIYASLILFACDRNIQDNSERMRDNLYGIDKSNAHPKSLELATEDFFWNPADELSPFGSDEGFTALEEYREWRKRNPNNPTYDCLKWTIEEVGEINIDEYNEKLTDSNLIKFQMNDPNFDTQQYIYTLDVSVIATGFGQLVDEGKIDNRNKGLILIALKRQKNWAKLQLNWASKDEYIKRMNILINILEKA